MRYLVYGGFFDAALKRRCELLGRADSPADARSIMDANARFSWFLAFDEQERELTYHSPSDNGRGDLSEKGIRHHASRKLRSLRSPSGRMAALQG